MCNICTILLDLTLGEDTLREVPFIGGGSGSVEAGGLLSLAVGAQIETSDDVNMVVTVGWKSDSINAVNGELEFSRLPINALALYVMGQWQVGGGITYHMNPEYSENSPFANVTAKFDDAVGFLADVRYFYSERSYVGGRYTMIDYEIGSITVDGNSIGITAGIVFE